MTTTTPPIAVRRATPQDAAALARLLAHPQVQPNLMQLPHAFEERTRAYLTDVTMPGKTDLQLVAERAGADGDSILVGSASLHPAGPALRRRHVMTLAVAVAAEAHGQGVGQALMAALCDYADRWAQVLRLELTVFADNARAIALYERFGFRQEGRHIGFALRDGAYVDALAMARLHPQPPRWQAA